MAFEQAVFHHEGVKFDLELLLETGEAAEESQLLGDGVLNCGELDFLAISAGRLCREFQGFRGYVREVDDVVLFECEEPGRRILAIGIHVF